MKFVTDNYIWFIVGGIVLVMAIIGYFADKTDFGRKKTERVPKEPKPKKEKPVKEKIEVSNRPLSEIINENANKEEVIEKPKEDIPVEIPDELFVPLTAEQPIDTSPIETIPTEPVSLDSKEVVNPPVEEPVTEWTISQQPEEVKPVETEEEDIWKF